MNPDLQRVLIHSQPPEWASNPAVHTLIADYAAYHLVFLVTGGVVFLALLALSLFCGVKLSGLRATAGAGRGFAKKVHASFLFLSAAAALLLALILVANAANALSPTHGFSLLARASTTSGDAELDRALSAWVNSGERQPPALISRRVQARVSYQAPKAVICGLLLALSAALSCRIWAGLIRTRSSAPASWRGAVALSAGITTAAFAFLMLLMVLGNTQGAAAPIAITVLGAGG